MKTAVMVLSIMLVTLPAFGSGKNVTYEVNGQEYEGYFVSKNEGAPLLMLIHDWDGLTDYEMKRAEMLAEIGRLHPSVRVLILSMHDDPEYVAAAKALGANGYLLKDISTEEIISAIEAEGGSAYCFPVMEIAPFDELVFVHRIFKREHRHVASDNVEARFWFGADFLRGRIRCD